MTALAALLAGCGNFVASSGVYYNSGLSDASNSVLLANIVRAAKGYPVYYSAIGDYSASRSLSGNLNVNTDFSAEDAAGSDLGLSSVGVSVGPSLSVDRNANASSLETRAFISAMHTRITPELFAIIVESGGATNLNLKLALLVESLAITPDEYSTVVAGAQAACGHGSDALAGMHRALCSTLAATATEANCGPARPSPVGGSVRLRNDPSSACEYSRFRLFIESFILNQPRLTQTAQGMTVVTLGTAPGGKPLFGPEGTGFLLRSPSGVVGYLGHIVREAYRTGWTPRLTTPDGDSAAIFVVHRDKARGRLAVSARVDDEAYWVAKQELGVAQRDFSNAALAVVKDFQAINTSPDQLPKSPSILLGR